LVRVKRFVAPVLVCVTLAVPASASARASSPTVALDYRLVLDDPTRVLHDVSVSVLDGDRALRVQVRQGTLTVLGDLREPMLRIGRSGTWVNRASLTAAAARLTSQGHGWKRIGGTTFTWHDHRLAPPPYDGGRVGAVARFRIPVTRDGEAAALGGTFVRFRRPPLWPWLAGAAAAGLVVAVALRLRPVVRTPLATALGAVAGAAALTALVSFGWADAPNGRVAWVQIALGWALAGAVAAGFVRLRGERRTVLAGLVGAAAAVASIGSLGVFRHGVVVSLLPASLSRAVCAVAVVAGLAAAGTVFVAHGDTA
jgi:hypothetical protein